MRSIASSSGSNIRVDSGTVEWLRLYWFCHDIGTDARMIAARSALPKGIFPFFVVGTVDPQIPEYGQTLPRSSSRTCQHHLNVAREPTRLS
jgi:hypothetical protein